MIPLKITPEQYVKYHSPAPDYLFAVRQMTYDKVGRVVVPEMIINGSLKFLGAATILKVSPYKSDVEQVEYIKEVLKDKKHITFEFHAIAQVQLMPEFKFESGIEVVIIHVKDVTGYGENLDELLAIQKEYERDQERNSIQK